MINSSTYVRSKDDFKGYHTEGGLSIYELLGKQNGNSEVLSVAHEEFIPGGFSPAHHHNKAEEYQFIFEGQGTLTIGNETRTVKKGDFIKIASGMRHQTTANQNEALKLWCFLTPSWTSEDIFFEEKSSCDRQDEIYIRRKEDEDSPKTGERIYEFLGKENGSSHDLSIAHVEIDANCFSEAHLHPEAEEAYIVLEGEGRLIVDGETTVIKRNQLAQIPKGKIHQIFNDSQETLKFLCACTPAWTDNCYIKV